jgi:hypothetical protein
MIFSRAKAWPCGVKAFDVSVELEQRLGDGRTVDGDKGFTGAAASKSPMESASS